MALSTSFTTWVDYPGTPSTPGASDINRLQDNDKFFAQPPMVIARRTFPQSIGHSTSTPVRFDQTVFDNDEMHFNGSSVAEFIEINTPGFYVFSFTMIWDAPPGGAAGQGWRMIRLWRMDAGYVARVNDQAQAQAGLGMGQQLNTTPIACSPIDRFRVEVMHAQGSTLNVGAGEEYDATISARWVARL